jgi:DnaK suppressor protein
MRNMELVDRERYDVLKSLLQDRAREITDKLRTLRETLPDELAAVKDPEEQCVHEFARGLDFALIEMKSKTLARINDALMRLEDRTYGVCLDCEQPIGNARLQALPFADRCRQCQEAREELASATSKQQSRFALPGLDSEPAETPSAPPVARSTRDAVRAPRRGPAPAAARTTRRARPGQLALRETVAAMERASKALSAPLAVTPTPSAIQSRPRAITGRGRRTRTTKHA